MYSPVPLVLKVGAGSSFCPVLGADTVLEAVQKQKPKQELKKCIEVTAAGESAKRHCAKFGPGIRVSLFQEAA